MVHSQQTEQIMTLAYKRGFHAGRDGESFRLKKAYLRPFANAEFIAGYSAGLNSYGDAVRDYFGSGPGDAYGDCWS